MKMYWIDLPVNWNAGTDTVLQQLPKRIQRSAKEVRIVKEITNDAGIRRALVKCIEERDTK